MQILKECRMDPQPVNFYFGGLDKAGFVNPSDSADKKSTNYIIFQNDRLHAMLKKLEDELHELTLKNDELENDNESLETSKTNLKGYVQNQGEYNRLSKKLVDVYETAITGINKYKDELEWNIKYLGLAFILLEIALFIYKLYNFDLFGAIEMFILNGAVAYIVSKVYKPYTEIVKIRNIKYTQTVVKIKEELKETSKGNDYLNDLIDRL
jgi:hypothetical protein